MLGCSDVYESNAVHSSYESRHQQYELRDVQPWAAGPIGIDRHVRL